MIVKAAGSIVLRKQEIVRTKAKKSKNPYVICHLTYGKSELWASVPVLNYNKNFDM